MSTILYATDYSENAAAALKYGYALSVKLNAQLLVIHIFDYPTILGTKEEKPILHLEKDAFSEHTSKLKKYCKKHLGNDFDKTIVKIEAIENKSVVNGIVLKAKESQPLLIITGMKGSSKLREIIMGNATKHLINKAPYPVLSIPSETGYNTIKTIIYATDFEEEDFGAINDLTEIAKPLNAKIKIVHIAPIKESIEKGQKVYLKEKLQQHINYANIELDILYSDTIFKDLKIYYGKENADIIAMLERENSSITATIFHRDLVKKMESYGCIPLLSFNAKNYGIFHL